MAARTVGFLNNVGEAVPSSRSAALAAHQLSGVEGFDMQSWEALADGLGLPLRDQEDNVPGGMKRGWQHGMPCTTVESIAMTENEMSKRLSSLV